MIQDVQDTKIYVQFEDGTLDFQGKRGFVFYLEHFNRKGERLKRKHSSSTQWKEDLIVELFTGLKWADNKRFIEVVS